MKNKLYSILDVKAETMTPPFCAYNDELAKRMICTSLQNAGAVPPNQFPQDFCLMCLGELTNEGVEPLKPARSIGNLLNIMAEMSARQQVAENALSRDKIPENSSENV